LGVDHNMLHCTVSLQQHGFLVTVVLFTQLHQQFSYDF